MKSRPVYSGLRVNPHAQRHLFALEGEGARACLDQLVTAEREQVARTEILYIPQGSQPQAHEVTMRELGPRGFQQAPSVAVLLHRLRRLLSTARMGTQLYAAGSEGFIGQVLQVASEAGMDVQSVSTEHRGTLARRVQCVHCKGITENVSSSPFRCTHCGLALFVRDHYSRRIGAFQGVNVDAEVPGSIPPSRELYP